MTGGERIPLRAEFSPEELSAVCELAESLDFGDDLRGTAEWRRAVAPELVRRAVKRAAKKPLAEKEA